MDSDEDVVVPEVEVDEDPDEVERRTRRKSGMSFCCSVKGTECLEGNRRWARWKLASGIWEILD